MQGKNFIAQSWNEENVRYITCIIAYRNATLIAQFAISSNLLKGEEIGDISHLFNLHINI